MANRRFIDFPIAASVGNNDIVLIWQDGLNKQTTKATLLQGSPSSLAGLTDVDISALTNGQILQYNSTTSKWENVDRTDINLSELGDVTIVAPANGQVLVYNSSTSKWENSSAGYVPYTGAVTTVNLGAQSILAGSFVKAGGTAAQFLKANGSVDSTAYGTGSVTSVALTMPTAFTVAGSPITTAGTLAVTGAGTVGQYIRGDGSLADFPATTGGGSSVSYYLNGSVSQGTIGGVAYKELNRTPIFGAGTDITINADGYIASFITDAGDPNKLLIPAGNWNLETYFSASSNGGSPSFYVELYKYNGTTFTLIASSSSAPELIAFGTILNPYYSTLAVPETVLALTDRLALRYYVTHSGRTITLHTENNHLCQVITTFTTGLTALNGLTSQVQYLTVGTSGTDFAISSATDTHTFNLPTASATNRGALSSADWTTFNGKTSNLGTVTSVGLSSATSGVTIGSTPVTTSGTITLAIATASGSQNGLLSSTDWTTFNGKQNALTNPVTGTGTTNYLPKFTGASTIGNSNIQDSGTLVSVGVAANFSSSINLFSAGVDTGMLLTDSSDFYLGAQTGKGLRLCTNNLGNTRLFISVSGNVGINTTSVSGTYEKLAVAGGISIKDNTNAKLEIGRYNTTGAQNSYIKLGANSNSLRFTNNTDTIDLMELTNSGTVFIGTTASTTYGTLVVVQNSVSSPNFVRGLQIVHPNGTGATGGYISMSNIGQKLGAIQVGDDLTTGNLVLNPVGGNVGINTNAVVKFQVNDGTNINLGIKVGQTDSSAVMLNAFNDAASANIPLEFRGSRFTFQNGNVGIGVTPNAWGGTNVKALEVYLASISASLTWGSAFTFNTFYDGSNWKYIGPYTAGKYEIGGDEHIFSNAPGGTAGATATFTTRMQITATGKVQIGTGTPDGLLTINSTTTALSAITNADSSVKAGYFWHQATSGDNQLVQFFTDGGVQRGAIDFNRAAGLVRYLVTSDKNLKNVVGDSDKTQSVNILNSTKIREYFWKDDKSKKLQIGVIAQELHQTFKGAVSVGSDEQDLNKENYKTWSVDKTAFTFHLIAGFQEHERIIKELKQEIYNLKN